MGWPVSFIDGDSRDQISLLPACVDDYVAPDALVRVVDAFVASLDLAELGFNRVAAATTGRPGYQPGDMLGLYVWGYLNQVRSSRHLERACGAAHYDDNLHVVEIIDNPEDGGDLRNAVDYSDVVGFLVGVHAARPEGLPVRSYSGLYDGFRALSPETRSAIEWFVSQPPSPRRLDPLFGHYWGLLHIMIHIETLIGLPPACECLSPECEVCKAPPRSHHKIPRGVWLRQELTYRMEAPQLVEEYASLIEAGKSIRDKMSHVPHFDRSTPPPMSRGQVDSYDVSTAASKSSSMTPTPFSPCSSLFAE